MAGGGKSTKGAKGGKGGKKHGKHHSRPVSGSKAARQEHEAALRIQRCARARQGWLHALRAVHTTALVGKRAGPKPATNNPTGWQRTYFENPQFTSYLARGSPSAL